DGIRDFHVTGVQTCALPILTLPSGVPARVARPANGEPTAGLVIAPDIGGLRPLFDDLCERLADENGWVVCAPEPFPGREDMTLRSEERRGGQERRLRWARYS